MLKLFSASDLFGSELPTTKTWSFPTIDFKGQVKVKCQCEEEGKYSSPWAPSNSGYSMILYSSIWVSSVQLI